MLSEVHQAFLQSLEPAVLDGSLAPGFDLSLANNTRHEHTKPVDKQRSPATLRSHNARGVGFEQYLLERCDFFEDHNVIVEDSRTRPRDERERDFKYNGEFVQIKTFKLLLGNYAYLSEHMFYKIQTTAKFNSFFVFGVSVPQSNDEATTTFEYRPAFAIESDFLKKLSQLSFKPLKLDGLSRRPDLFQPLCKELVELT